MIVQHAVKRWGKWWYAFTQIVLKVLTNSKDLIHLLLKLGNIEIMGGYGHGRNTDKDTGGKLVRFFLISADFVNYF